MNIILILSEIIACTHTHTHARTHARTHTHTHTHTHTQGETFKVLQAIISESMRRIKNMFRQKFCKFKGDIR